MAGAWRSQGKTEAIRHQPGHLIVMHRPKGGPVRVIYNGPGAEPWAQAGKMQSNGQRTISLPRLLALNAGLADDARLAIKWPPPV
jgi:hypothetical protein